MERSKVSQGIQYGRGQKSSTTTCSTFKTRRDQIYQSWNEEGFSSLYQALLICEMADPYTSKSAQVAFEAAIKTKIDREECKRGYEGQIEGPYPSEKIKVQEDIFKATTKLIVRWVWYNHPIIERNNTCNYTLSHLYRVRGFRYLRHLCVDQIQWCKCPSRCHIRTSLHVSTAIHLQGNRISRGQ